MQIDIPLTDQQRLAEHAKAAGFDDVERFVAEHLTALAHLPTSAELRPLSTPELEASLAMCDRSMEQLAAGEGLSVEESLEACLAQIGRQDR